MAPLTEVAESVLEEIDLEIVDPFGDDQIQNTVTTVTTTPIPQPTPPPQHARKCVDETYLRMRQKTAD